jgi:hypothetical protein
MGLATEDIRREFRLVYSAIKEQKRQFLSELALRLVTGKCDIQDGRLRYRERFWLPNYKPLTTTVI